MKNIKLTIDQVRNIYDSWITINKRKVPFETYLQNETKNSGKSR